MDIAIVLLALIFFFLAMWNFVVWFFNNHEVREIYSELYDHEHHFTQGQPNK